MMYGYHPVATTSVMAALGFFLATTQTLFSTPRNSVHTSLGIFFLTTSLLQYGMLMQEPRKHAHATYACIIVIAATFFVHEQVDVWDTALHNLLAVFLAVASLLHFTNAASDPLIAVISHAFLQLGGVTLIVASEHVKAFYTFYSWPWPFAFNVMVIVFAVDVGFVLALQFVYKRGWASCTCRRRSPYALVPTSPDSDPHVPFQCVM